MDELQRSAVRTALWFILLTQFSKANIKIDGLSSIDDMIAFCSPEKLIVKGNVVKISDVLNVTCMGKANYIEMFALDKIIIDADIDKTGQNAQISLIAPTWEIVNERKIILNGKIGSSFASVNASNGIGSFKHGKPGKAGGSGEPIHQWIQFRNPRQRR